MSLSINWTTQVITVPQSYLTFLSGSDYELDVDQFRKDLNNIQDSEEGMPFLDTHRHNTEVVLGTITLARVVEIINGYSVTFEDGQYIVNLTGANNNLLDVTNLNQVSIRSSNSAGLITVISGSGVLPQDIVDIADAVLDETLAGHTDSDSVGEALRIARQMVVGRWKFDDTAKTLTFYESDGLTVLVVFDMKDDVGNATLEGVYERVPQ